MKTINVAVIGTGFIGPAHLEALRRVGGVKVVAIASNEPERAAELAAKFAVPQVYGDWKSVIGDETVDVVHNCTPNNLHYSINKAALLSGKHVVSEKPLTMTGAESAELVRLAAKYGKVNAVNFNYRFYPLTQQARAMVRKGELGTIYLVHGHYLQDWLLYDTDYSWRLETSVGGDSRAIADIGSHWFDLVQFITGLKITSVCANLVTVHKSRNRPKAAVQTFKGKEQRIPLAFDAVKIKTEDAGTVLVRFENGAIGTLTVSQVSAGRKNCEWLEVDGSRAAVAWGQEEPNQLWVGHREKPNEVLVKDPSLLDARVRKYAHYPGGHPEGYPDVLKNLFMNVYDFVRKGRDPRTEKPNFPTFVDGHRENRIVEAVLRSNASKRWVVVKK